MSDFPFQVLLFVAGSNPASPAGHPDDGGGRFCGGVIRDATHVITAAHCVWDVFNPGQASSPNDVEVLVGTDDLSPQDGTAKSVVASALSFDPRYDPDKSTYDTALVTLPSDQPLYTGTPSPGAPIRKIDLVTDLEWSGLGTGDPLTVSGWGDTNPWDGVPADQQPIFSNHLQAAQVPFVDPSTCSNDYGGLDTSLLFCAGDGADPNTIADSCQGDSGGPIVLDTNPPNKQYVLVGLVDSGSGCAQQGSPGIYTQLANHAIQDFVTTPDPVPAPTQPTRPTLVGGNQPGQTLTCHSDAWSDPNADLTYEFLTTAGVALTNPSAGGATYTIQSSDAGNQILCEVGAKNQGGYGFADSLSVLVPVPPQPPPPAAKDTAAPKLRVAAKACTKTSCTLTLFVTDSPPSSGLAKPKATLSFKRRVKCRKTSSARAAKTCKKTVRRGLQVTGGTGGKFTVVAKHLTPDTSYRIALVPFDRAGNRPQFSTITNVRTKPRHRRLL